MNMTRSRWLHSAILVGLAGLAPACRNTSSEPAGAGTITAAENAVPTGPAAAQAERLPHCPSAVGGATTVVAEVPGGVELRITALGAGASEIRKRAASLASASSETRGQHRASGAQRGQFGRCPVVMRNTVLDAHDIPNGAAIVLKPSSESELEWLRREVETRSAQIAAPKLFGPGLMKVCPNAVPNAETKIHDAPDGVDVMVTASSEEGVRAIRERAHELVSSAAVEERCPVTVPGTKVVVADTPRGATISLKEKRPEDARALQKVVHDRARSFTAPVVNTK